MTLQEVKAMGIGIQADCTPCLYRQTKNGKKVPVRPITAEESAAICALLYKLHQTVHQGDKVMYLPFGEGKALAVTEVETQP